ncbi:MAG TPA: DUF131 domain-containing protein [Thermoplasmata archaeon]|jgi:uncharacterized protein (TIGR00304 family)|nr:DUF131 domain-containing protein [Thermoplasmata archaeon]
MRRLTLLAVAALFGGIALLAYSAVIGQGQVHLVLIFPVFTGTGVVSFLGMMLVFAAFMLWFWSAARIPFATAQQTPPQAAPPSSPAAAPGAAPKFGGVVFLGPFPIVFGSDRTVTKYMLVLGIAMTVLLLAFFFLVLLR